MSGTRCTTRRKHVFGAWSDPYDVEVAAQFGHSVASYRCVVTRQSRTCQICKLIDARQVDPGKRLQRD